MGPSQHCNRRLFVLSPPNEFLHSSPEAPRTTQARETSAGEGRNYDQGIQLANPEFTKVLGSFTCRKAGTWDRFFHFPSEGKHREDYSETRKIQRLRPVSNQRTRVPEASMLTTISSKPLRKGVQRRRPKISNAVFLAYKHLHSARIWFQQFVTIPALCCSRTFRDTGSQFVALDTSVSPPGSPDHCRCHIASGYRTLRFV